MLYRSQGRVPVGLVRDTTKCALDRFLCQTRDLKRTERYIVGSHPARKVCSDETASRKDQPLPKKWHWQNWRPHWSSKRLFTLYEHLELTAYNRPSNVIQSTEAFSTLLPETVVISWNPEAVVCKTPHRHNWNPRDRLDGWVDGTTELRSWMWIQWIHVNG